MTKSLIIAPMLKHSLQLLLALTFAPAAPAEARDYNQMILDIVAAQPKAGGHGPADPMSATNLVKSLKLVEGNIQAIPEVSVPTFCSAATYLVFIELITQLQKENPGMFSQETLKALLVTKQPDGYDTWGRWNANGPGVARLFHETGLGRNFLEWNEAKPGDFMKIFFNEFIGAKERGHLVVYLGTRMEDGEEKVFYWSSDPKIGRVYASMNRSKIKRHVFSRLEHPELLGNILKMPVIDPYTSTLLKADSPVEEMHRMIGL